MKKLKMMVLFLLTLGFAIFTTSQMVKADMGPKPAIIVEFTGLEGEDYTVTFLGKSARGPYQNEDYHDLDPNPVMDFTYEDYKFVGLYWTESGNSTVSWTYYPPNPFRILVRLEDDSYYISEELECYAFRSYFYFDFNNLERGAKGSVTLVDSVQKDYDYSQEIWNFILRLIITIIVELVIAILFLYRKKLLLITIVVNTISQIILNLILSLNFHYYGELNALIIFILAEIGVLLIEGIIYALTLKDKGLFRAIIYTVVANIITFMLSFISFNHMLR